MNVRIKGSQALSLFSSGGTALKLSAYSDVDDQIHTIIDQDIEKGDLNTQDAFIQCRDYLILMVTTTEG